MPMTFQEYATEHKNHNHCVACGGCLLDPMFQSMTAWCIGCRDKVKAGLPSGAVYPWEFEVKNVNNS